MFSDEEVERYARHLVLPEIGGQGQQKLARGRVLIVGAGGLGSPAALYLAAAGVGAIDLVDDDAVALSNLQRQILYATAEVGRPKTDVAAARLAELNPHVAVSGSGVRLQESNARAFVDRAHVVLDGTDDFATRFTVNAAAVAAGRPLVSGAVGRWSGQVGVFEGRPCYRCLVPEAPQGAETCAQVGVVGALTGVIGSLMAMEAIKLLAGAGEPLRSRLLVYEGLAGSARVARVAADPSCTVCGPDAVRPLSTGPERGS